MFSNVHDSKIVAYSVDSQTRQLVLSLAFGEASAAREFRLIFSGVIAHHFAYLELPSIVSSLEQVEAADILRRDWATIAEGSRQCGWPGP